MSDELRVWYANGDLGDLLSFIAFHRIPVDAWVTSDEDNIYFEWNH